MSGQADVIRQAIDPVYPASRFVDAALVRQVKEISKGLGNARKSAMFGKLNEYHELAAVLEKQPRIAMRQEIERRIDSVEAILRTYLPLAKAG